MTIIVVLTYFLQEEGCRGFNGKGGHFFYMMKIPIDFNNKNNWRSFVLPEVRKLKKCKNFKFLHYKGLLMEGMYMHYYNVSSNSYSCCSGHFDTADYLFSEEKNPKRKDLDIGPHDENDWSPSTISYKDALKKCLSIKDLNKLEF
jgi:hypothetical protein